MTNLSRVKTARQHVAAAIADSLADREKATGKHLFRAELELRRHDVGRPDLATRLERVLGGDVTTVGARSELREVAQKLDAELSPAVSKTAFVVASDGGAWE